MFRDPGTPKDAVSLGYAADVAEANLDAAIRRGPVPSAAVWASWSPTCNLIVASATPRSPWRLTITR